MTEARVSDVIRTIELYYDSAYGKDSVLTQMALAHGEIVTEHIGILDYQKKQRLKPWERAVIGYGHDIGKITGSDGHESKSVDLVLDFFSSLDNRVIDAIRYHSAPKRHEYAQVITYLADKTAYLNPRQMQLRRDKLMLRKENWKKDASNYKRTKNRKVIVQCNHWYTRELGRRLQQIAQLYGTTAKKEWSLGK